MAATASSFSTSGKTCPEIDHTMQLRRHEVAIAELNSLPSSRAVYQRNGNLFFRTTIQKAASIEQKLLDSAKSKLSSPNSLS